MLTVFYLYGRYCSFLGLTIFHGPYCWLFDCSCFASIIIIIIIIIIIFPFLYRVNILSILENIIIYKGPVKIKMK